MVDPYVLRVVDSDSVAANDFLQCEVAEDDVVGSLHCESEVLKDDFAVFADDGLVRSDFDALAAAFDRARDEDDGSIVALDGALKIRK